jgi:hypothetical protein
LRDLPSAGLAAGKVGRESLVLDAIFAGHPIGAHHRAWPLDSLHGPYIRGTRPFLSLSDVELNAVAFLKMIETPFLHFRMMEKQIPAIRFDESETAVADDFLDLSLGHDLAPQK